MGRLPATFAGEPIKCRIPYEMPGELILEALTPAFQYPDATFQNTINKTFEIHRMIPRIYAMLDDDAGDSIVVSPQPAQELLAGLVRVQITDLGLDQKLTKAATLIGTLTKGEAERTWEFAEPHYLPNNAQLQVILDTLAFPEAFDDEIDALRIAITFQGFLLVVGPPVS